MDIGLRRFSNILVVMAATALSLHWSASADSLSSLVVYGDSLSDNGNLFAVTGQPGAPYADGRRSDGPVAVEQLGAKLGVPLVDYAWIGATTGTGNYADGGTTTTFGTYMLPGILTEFDATKAAIGPNVGGRLFVVWGGANDFLAPSPLDTAPQQIIARGVGDIVTIVNGLIDNGAKNILVPGMPDLGLSPYFMSLGPDEAALGSTLTNAFNAALIADLPPGVKYFDTAQLLRNMVANPAAYGFTNVTDACFNGTTVCANPSQYLFFDDFHPTSEADAFVADGFLSTVVPEPANLLIVGMAFLGLVICRNRIRTLCRKLPLRACLRGLRSC